MINRVTSIVGAGAVLVIIRVEHNVLGKAGVVWHRPFFYFFSTIRG